MRSVFFKAGHCWACARAIMSCVAFVYNLSPNTFYMWLYGGASGGGIAPKRYFASMLISRVEGKVSMCDSDTA
jgi:hypothetical protein